MIRSFYIDIPSNKKDNFFVLYIYILQKVFKYLIVPLLVLITLVLCIHKHLLKMTNIPNIFICIFLILLSITLEETFHASMLIIQGRGNQVKSLRFDAIQFKKIKICIGVSVYFNGEFTSNDILYISLAGPIMSLLFGLILFLIISVLIVIFVHKIQLTYFFILFLGLLMVGMFSLVPFNKFFIKTDGYKVYELIKKYKIKPKNILKTISMILKYCLTFVFRSLKVT